MKELSKNSIIGVIGAGTMGSGIAQVAASAGHKTILLDANRAALEKAENAMKATLAKLIEKGKMKQEDAESIQSRIQYSTSIKDFKGCSLVIEAIIEKIEVKQQLFSELEKIVDEDCILATNTSSLSITSIAAACANPKRIIGIHFFNPAPVMPLVELIPGISTDDFLVSPLKKLLTDWGKSVVIAKIGRAHV